MADQHQTPPHEGQDERATSHLPTQRRILAWLQVHFHALRTGAVTRRRGSRTGTASASQRNQSQPVARTSRRRVLQIGGATAAAAAGAAAVELVQPPATALANGITWQTGVVNADNQTWVEPAGGSFPDPTLLTVRLGTAAPYDELFGANSAAIAAYDTMASESGYAIYGTSINGNGVIGEAEGNGWGVAGISTNGLGVYGESNSGTGVEGESNSGTAVYGKSDSGDGVQGISNGSGNGVFARSSSGVGVQGVSPSSVGVQGVSVSSMGLYGISSTGSAVVGSSVSGVGGLFAGGTAPVQLFPSEVPGAPTSGAHQLGQIWLDSSGILWVCITQGTPGNWVRLTSVHSGSSGGATTYLSKPIRLLDTRPGATDALHNGGGPYTAAGSPYPLTIAGASYNGVTISSGAVGAIGNVTAIGTSSGAGTLAVGRHGAGSGLAVVRYTANQTVENSFNVGLGSGQVDLAIGGNPANVILDVYAIVA
jgi:hypothetical protein